MGRVVLVTRSVCIILAVMIGQRNFDEITVIISCFCMKPHDKSRFRMSLKNYGTQHGYSIGI
jgi:hypothetical protein